MEPEFRELRPAEVALLTEREPRISQIARLTVGDLCIRGYLAFRQNQQGETSVTIRPARGTGGLRPYEEPYLLSMTPETPPWTASLGDYLAMVFGRRPLSHKHRWQIIRQPHMEPYFKRNLLHNVFKIERMTDFGQARGEVLTAELNRLRKEIRQPTAKQLEAHVGYGGHLLLILAFRLGPDCRRQRPD